MKLKLLVVATMVLTLFGCGMSEEVEEMYDSREYTTLSKVEIQKARESIRSILKDPYSAKFGKYQAFTYIENGYTKTAMCGFVNAKNSYGGYVGNEVFITRKLGKTWGNASLYGKSVCEEFAVFIR